jgi:hypothetical protein
LERTPGKNAAHQQSEAITAAKTRDLSHICIRHSRFEIFIVELIGYPGRTALMRPMRPQELTATTLMSAR